MLVKLAFAMQRLKKYLTKNVVMINKDGEGNNFWILWGHSCYEEGHRAHWGSPTRDNPVQRHFLALNQLNVQTFK